MNQNYDKKYINNFVWWAILKTIIQAPSILQQFGVGSEIPLSLWTFNFFELWWILRKQSWLKLGWEILDYILISSHPCHKLLSLSFPNNFFWYFVKRWFEMWFFFCDSESEINKIMNKRRIFRILNRSTPRYFVIFYVCLTSFFTFAE